MEIYHPCTYLTHSNPLHPLCLRSPLYPPAPRARWKGKGRKKEKERRKERGEVALGWKGDRLDRDLRCTGVV